MARSVFFSFHHQSDSWRVGQVRNAWLTKGLANQFMDAAAWEEIQKKGEANVKRWIDRQLNGTSVTAILIGADTSNRPYVRYEIEESIKKGNGLLGIYIHQVKDRFSRTTVRGRNPLDDFEVPETTPIVNLFFSTTRASGRYRTYDWVDDNGRENLNNWIEEAANLADR